MMGLYKALGPFSFSSRRLTEPSEESLADPSPAGGIRHVEYGLLTDRLGLLNSPTALLIA